MHSLQSGVPGLLRLQHLILAIFCELSLALQLERGSMTRRCALPSHCVLAPRCALYTPVSAAAKSTVPGSTAWHVTLTSHAPQLCKLSTEARADVRQHPGDTRAALSRDDGKRPDGMTVLPGTNGSGLYLP
jgi:hypothetical protein